MAGKAIKGMSFTKSKPIRQSGKGANGNKIEGISYVNSPALGPGCPAKGCRVKKTSGKVRVQRSVDMKHF